MPGNFDKQGEFSLQIEGIETLEIELFNEAFNFDGNLPQNIEKDYFDMASSIKPFLVYAFGKLVNIQDAITPIQIFSEKKIEELASEFVSYKTKEFPDPIHLFFANEKGFKTQAEVLEYLRNGMSFEDIAIAACKYSSNDIIPAMRKFAADKLEITQEEVANRYQNIIRDDFSVNEIYIRMSTASKNQNAHNIGSFVQLSKAYQKLLNAYQTDSGNIIVKTVFESLSKGHSREFLKQTDRIQEIGYIFDLVNTVFVSNKAGLNIRELNTEHSEYLALKNRFSLQNYSYRLDIFAEDHPKELDAVVHLSDFAFVNVQGEIKLVSYMTSVRVKVKLKQDFIDKLRHETMNMEKDDAEDYVLEQFIQLEYQYAKLVKKRVLGNIQQRFPEGLPIF